MTWTLDVTAPVSLRPEVLGLHTITAKFVMTDENGFPLSRRTASSAR